MMKALPIVSILTLILSANSAFAARPGYTYAGAGFINQHLDEYRCSQDGLYLEGGLALDGQLIVQARHTDVTSNSGCGSTTTELSLGIRNEYGTSSSVYGLGSLVNRDYGSDSDAGFGVSVGIRTVYRPAVELGISASYEAIDSVNQLYVTGSAKYRIVQKFQLGVDLGLNDDGNTSVSFGGRYTF